MREHGLDERLIRATASHGYGLAQNDIEPQHQMEKVLFAIDELSGLIGAAAIMRPSKSIMDLELKSVKKKYKDKKFAAGCSRDVIEKGAANLGWTVDELIEKTILAMREDEADIKQRKISVGSPIARALIGKEEGDVAEVQAPGGVREYEIVQVQYL